MYKYLFVLLSLAAISNGQVINAGPCPNVTSMTGFNSTKFQGTWYTVRQYPTIYETIARCPTIKYTKNADGNFTIRQTQINLINNTPMVWEGIGRFPEGPTVGKWNWNLPLVPIDLPFLPYQVLGTDYDSYATIYSCINLGSFNLKQLWILTKKYPLFVPANTVPDGTAAVQRAGLNTTLLLPSIQILCPLPEINIFTLLG